MTPCLYFSPNTDVPVTYGCLLEPRNTLRRVERIHQDKETLKMYELKKQDLRMNVFLRSHCTRATYTLPAQRNKPKRTSEEITALKVCHPCSGTRTLLCSIISWTFATETHGIVRRHEELWDRMLLGVGNRSRGHESKWVVRPHQRPPNVHLVFFLLLLSFLLPHHFCLESPSVVRKLCLHQSPVAQFLPLVSGTYSQSFGEEKKADLRKKKRRRARRSPHMWKPIIQLMQFVNMLQLSSYLPCCLQSEIISRIWSPDLATTLHQYWQLQTKKNAVISLLLKPVQRRIMLLQSVNLLTKNRARKVREDQLPNLHRTSWWWRERRMTKRDGEPSVLCLYNPCRPCSLEITCLLSTFNNFRKLHLLQKFTLQRTYFYQCTQLIVLFWLPTCFLASGQFWIISYGWRWCAPLIMPASRYQYPLQIQSLLSTNVNDVVDSSSSPVLNLLGG